MLEEVGSLEVTPGTMAEQSVFVCTIYLGLCCCARCEMACGLVDGGKTEPSLGMQSLHCLSLIDSDVVTCALRVYSGHPI
jgi:hypothetical protein